MIRDVSRGTRSWNVAPQPPPAFKSGCEAPLKEVGPAFLSDHDSGDIRAGFWFLFQLCEFQDYMHVSFGCEMISD